MSECKRGWKIEPTSAFGCGIFIRNESTLSFLTVEDAEAMLNEHAELLEALERAINEPDWKYGAPDYMHEAIRTAKEM